MSKRISADALEDLINRCRKFLQESPEERGVSITQNSVADQKILDAHASVNALVEAAHERGVANKDFMNAHGSWIGRSVEITTTELADTPDTKKRFMTGNRCMHSSLGQMDQGISEHTKRYDIDLHNISEHFDAAVRHILNNARALRRVHNKPHEQLPTRLTQAPYTNENWAPAVVR